jgi:hypothetical protein
MKILIDGGYEYEIGPDGKVLYIHRKNMEQKLGRKLTSDEVVHHIDENKLNNDPDNLELTDSVKHGKHHWDLKTEYELEKHKEWASKHGKINGPKNCAIGSKHPNSKLNEDKVKRIKELLKDGQSQSSLGRLYNVDRTVIRDIKFNRSWKHVN